MPDPNCHIPVVCDANADSNSYSHTDRNCDCDPYPYSYAYSDGVRQRDNRKRWIRDR